MVERFDGYLDRIRLRNGEATNGKTQYARFNNVAKSISAGCHTALLHFRQIGPYWTSPDFYIRHERLLTVDVPAAK